MSTTTFEPMSAFIEAASNSLQITSSAATTTTTTSSGLSQTGPNACDTAFTSILSCSIATPSFEDHPLSVQASCYCFDGNGRYNGDLWDGVARDCFAVMHSRSIASELISAFEPNVDLCTKSVDSHWKTAGVVPAGQNTTSKPSQTILVTSTPTAAARKDSGASLSSTQARIIIGLISSLISIAVILMGFFFLRRHRIRKRAGTEAKARIEDNDQPYLQRKNELKADEKGFHEMGPEVKPGGMVAVTVLHEMGPSDRGRRASIEKQRRISSVQELESPEYPPSPGRRQLRRTFSELG